MADKQLTASDFELLEKVAEWLQGSTNHIRSGHGDHLAEILAEIKGTPTPTLLQNDLTFLKSIERDARAQGKAKNEFWGWEQQFETFWESLA